MGKKHFFATALVVLAAFALAACGSKAGSNNPAPSPVLVQGSDAATDAPYGVNVGRYEDACRTLTLQEVRTMLKIPSLEYSDEPYGVAGAAPESHSCMFTSNSTETGPFNIGVEVKHDPDGKLYTQDANAVKNQTHGIYEYRDLSGVGDTAFAAVDVNGRVVGIESRWGVWTLTVGVYGDLTFQLSTDGMVQIMQTVMSRFPRTK